VYDKRIMLKFLFKLLKIWLTSHFIAEVIRHMTNMICVLRENILKMTENLRELEDQVKKL
jgi:hypothetical protein